jgi:hypothetical protein
VLNWILLCYYTDVAELPLRFSVRFWTAIASSFLRVCEDVSAWVRGCLYRTPVVCLYIIAYHFRDRSNYRSIMLDTVHFLGYICYTRRFDDTPWNENHDRSCLKALRFQDTGFRLCNVEGLNQWCRNRLKTFRLTLLGLPLFIIGRTRRRWFFVVFFPQRQACRYFIVHPVFFFRRKNSVP